MSEKLSTTDWTRWLAYDEKRREFRGQVVLALIGALRSDFFLPDSSKAVDRIVDSVYPPMELKE